MVIASKSMEGTFRSKRTMRMKHKHIAMAAACVFLIAAGAVYSFGHRRRGEQEIILTCAENEAEDDMAGITENKVYGSPDSHDADAGPLNQEKDGTNREEGIIYVHLCGAVVNPGVYKVEKGTRLVELIDYAGGLVLEAADEYVNQAMAVEDGQRIYIPTKEELKELSVQDYITGDKSNQADSQAVRKVNINTADENELMTLPGIGQAKARSIIEYRKKNGSFKSITDLTNIPGIKEGLLARIEDMITVK